MFPLPAIHGAIEIDSNVDPVVAGKSSGAPLVGRDFVDQGPEIAGDNYGNLTHTVTLGVGPVLPRAIGYIEESNIDVIVANFRITDRRILRVTVAGCFTRAAMTGTPIARCLPIVQRLQFNLTPFDFDGGSHGRFG
jgi:hypothetical protein